MNSISWDCNLTLSSKGSESKGVGQISFALAAAPRNSSTTRTALHTSVQDHAKQIRLVDTFARLGYEKRIQDGARNNKVQEAYYRDRETFGQETNCAGAEEGR
jgi:hypothetical protein